MRYLIGAALVLLAVAGEARAQAESERKLSVFILDVKVEDGSPIDAQTATEVLTARAGKLPFFDYTNRLEFAALLEQVATQQALGIDDVNALQAIGKEAAADKLIFATIGTVGKTAVCKLVVIDVKSGEVEHRVVRVAKAQEKSVIIRTLATMSDATNVFLIRKYQPGLIAKKAPSWRVEPHPVAWGLLAGGLGLAAGAGIAHGTEATDGGAGIYASYGVGGAMAIAGALLAITGIGGRRIERGSALWVPSVGPSGGGISFVVRH